MDIFIKTSKIPMCWNPTEEEDYAIVYCLFQDGVEIGGAADINTLRLEYCFMGAMDAPLVN